MKKTYQSKIGLELLIPIILILGFSFYNVFKNPQLFSGIFTFLVIIFVALVIFGNRYTIEGNTLTIKNSFLVNKKIEISSIQEIKKSNNIISSPASSLKRLDIIYDNGKSILISPKNQDFFVEELLNLNPNIKTYLS